MANFAYIINYNAENVQIRFYFCMHNILAKVAFKILIDVFMLSDCSFKAPSQKKAKIVPIVALKIFNQKDPINRK